MAYKNAYPRTINNMVRAKRKLLILFFAVVLAVPLLLASTIDSRINIQLYYKGYEFCYTDRPIDASNHIIAEEIFNRKINADYRQKKQMMAKIVLGGGTYKYAVLFCMPLLEPIVQGAISKIKKEPIDSHIEFKPDESPMFIITKEKNGTSINEEKLYRDIYLALQKNSMVKVKIKTEQIPASITADDNKELTHLRTRYSTDYTNSSQNRKHNIKLALKNVNGTVIEPQEEFSFNTTVGKRTEKNGFKEGTVILMGKYQKGIGGGVCQVSTTVYNAALLSGLKITAARAHSLECSYELPSFDAMVNEGSQDLRFVNTGRTPVFIRAYGTQTTAYVEVYGKPLDYTIKRRTKIIHRLDAPMAQTIVDYEYKYHDADALTGEKKVVYYPHGELKSEGYLLYYDKNNLLIKQEKIRQDKYKESKGLIAIAP